MEENVYMRRFLCYNDFDKKYASPCPDRGEKRTAGGKNMAKKKRSKKQKKAPFGVKLLTLLLPLIVLTIDLFVLQFLVNGFEVEAAIGAAIFALGLVATLTGLGLCAIFRIIGAKYQSLQKFIYVLFFARLIILLAAGIAMVVARSKMMDPPLEGGLTEPLTTFILGALTALGIQIFVCLRFLESAFDPPAPYDPTKYQTRTTSSAPTSSSPSASSSSHTYTPSDGVRNTDFYKQKYDEYYKLYMGNPPTTENKSSTLDDDDHDYSHIFEDTNW